MALPGEQRQTVSFSFSWLRLQHVRLLPLKPSCSSSSVLSKSLHPFLLATWFDCELLWARLLLRSFLVSGEDPMYRAASWPCTSSLPCFAPQSPSSLETSACGEKELGEICFSGMSSLLPLPGIYAIFTCPNSQHHQKWSPHTHQKGFRDLCHAQWPGGPCPHHSSFLWPVDPPQVPSPTCNFWGDKSCCSGRGLGMATVSLRLGADAEASSRSVAQALQGKLCDCSHCPRLCKQP